MSKHSRSRNQSMSPYDLYVDSRGSIFDDDIPSSAIKQRISDSWQDDTHPSTDSDLDSQEVYDLGLR